MNRTRCERCDAYSYHEPCCSSMIGEPDTLRCSRKACGIELTPRNAHRRYEGSAYRDGDPYCAACASAINRHARRTIVIAPWHPGMIVRRISDGAHAEVLGWDGGLEATVRFGVAGSTSAPRSFYGYRKIAGVSRVDFEITQAPDA